ncbi:MAG TPA: NUDIX hydrolase [Propionibacterium sp.]|nr:NUDIX hydrolase [Propionibacterium sp.]
MAPRRKFTIAAGTVTVRERPGKEPHILLVHRPAYNDWTLPKGRLDPDEYEAVAAVRETWEETGVKVVLREPLGAISYPVGGGTKVVHYWRAEPLEANKRKPDKEVDKVAWLTPENALARMTYDDEKHVVRRALEFGPTSAFLVVRHSKAMDRKNWSGRDQARPITARGRKQAKRLIPLFEAFGIKALASSTSTRSMQTLQPYAKEHRLDIDGWQVLTEEIGEHNLTGVAQLITRLATESVDEDEPMAVCGHRPVLPAMLTALGVEPRPMQTGAVIVAHLDGAARLVAHEYHRPRV